MLIGVVWTILWLNLVLALNGEAGSDGVFLLLGFRFLSRVKRLIYLEAKKGSGMVILYRHFFSS